MRSWDSEEPPSFRAGAVAGSRPDGAFPALYSAVLGGPIAFSLLEISLGGAQWSPGLPWPQSPLHLAAPVSEF